MDLNSAKVKEIRTTKGWTQLQLAEISDLSLRTIQRVEVNGVGSLETSKALAAAFEVEREILLVLSESNANQEQLGLFSGIPVRFLLGSFSMGALFGAAVLWVFT